MREVATRRPVGGFFFANVSFLSVVASVGSFVRISPMPQTTITLNVIELN
jgi:hypothetical protein